MRGYLLPVRLGEILQRLLAHREHSAGAARSVVEEIRPGLDLVGDGQEDQLRHEADGIARRPVLAGLLVVLLVEPPDELLEDRPYPVVVQTRMLDGAVGVEHGLGTEVDVGGQELADEGSERIGLREPWDLVAEFEVVQYVLNVRRESLQVGLEVGPQLLLARARAQVAEREPRGVVEGLSGCVSEGLVLVGHALPVEERLHVEHVLFRWLENSVQTTENSHGQDDVAVLAADIEIPEHVVGDAPDEVGDPIQLCRFHASSFLADRCSDVLAELACPDLLR